MSAEVYSKDTCPNCVEAIALLKSLNLNVHVFKIVDNLEDLDEDNSKSITYITKQDLLERVPTARTVPQIFVNEKYIGGLSDLKAKLAHDSEF